MKISDVKSYITPKTTGYAAAGFLGVSLISAKSSKKCLRKIHKPVSYTSVVLTCAHIGLIEYNNYIWNKKTGK